MLETPKLTRRQQDVFDVVAANGPLTAADVAYHIPITKSSASGILARLEAKRLVAATYSGQSGRGRAYIARIGE